MQDNVKNRWISWTAATALFLLCFLLVLCLRADYSYQGLSDAFFFAGVIEIAFLAMIYIERFGAFDAMHYGLYRLFESFRPGPMRKRWDTFGDYASERRSKREVNRPLVLPYFIFGIVSLAFALGFLLAFQATK
jgi:hypothetical protein